MTNLFPDEFGTMATQKEATAWADREGFQIIPVGDVIGIDDPDRALEVTIPETAPAIMHKSGRDIIENPNKYSGYRWAAGGSVMVLRLKNGQRVLVCGMRSKGIKSYPGHLTIASGLSSGIHEMLYPMRIVWREGFEEQLIVTPDGWVTPYIQDKGTFSDPAGFGYEIHHILQGTARLFENLRGVPSTSAWATQLSLRGTRDVKVHSSHHPTTTTNALVNIDPNTNGIDLLMAFEVDLSKYTIDELTIFDGEIGGDRRSLNRTMVAAELTDEMEFTGTVLAAWSKGKRIDFDESDVPRTPVLQEVINAF